MVFLLIIIVRMILYTLDEVGETCVKCYAITVLIHIRNSLKTNLNEPENYDDEYLIGSIK